MKYIEHTLVGIVIVILVVVLAYRYPDTIRNISDSWESQVPVPTHTTPALPDAQQALPVQDKNETDVGAALDLSGQGLTRVPDSVFTRTNLTSLDVSNNNLSGALQAEVRHLTQLRSLNLSRNNFTGVPAEIGQLQNLELLDLSDNPITGLPLELGNLRNLKTLDLRNTQYSTQDLNTIRSQLPASTVVYTE